MAVEDTLPAFLKRHPPGEHPYLQLVHERLATGACAHTPMGGGISSDEILSIYLIRARVLADITTEHAKNLHRDVTALCERLEQNRGSTMRWWSFRMPDGSGYVLAEREDNGALLGAIRVVRKSGVSAEEWKRLWGDAV